MNSDLLEIFTPESSKNMGNNQLINKNDEEKNMEKSKLAGSIMNLKA